MEASFRDAVMVVDDEKVNRAILSNLVRRLGFQCREFATGNEALAAFQEANRSRRPIAAIMMDINMPGMDGLEAAWRIRAIEAAQRQLCSCQDAFVPSSAFTGMQAAQEDRAEACLPEFGSGHSPAEAEGFCTHCKALRTPIWAVSACSIREQAKSPAMRLVPASCTCPPWKLAGFDAFLPKPVPCAQLVAMLNEIKRERNSQPRSELPRDDQRRQRASAAAKNPIALPCCKCNACLQMQRNRAMPDFPVLAPQEFSAEVRSGDLDPLQHICTPAS